MLTNKIIIPKCAKSFTQWYTSNTLWEKIYNDLGCPTPFDVSLRDGLQSLSNDQMKLFTIENKKELYSQIVLNYQPKSIEIGSIVSNKILPVFDDTIDFFNYVNNKEYTINSGLYLKKPLENYILIPNYKKLYKVIRNPHVNYFSFITSVSNSFQKKNVNLSLVESDRDILNMINLLNLSTDRYQDSVIKLYVSCINECPIEGKIDNDFIVNRLLNLNNLSSNIHKICLSDTCGTLNSEDFEYIVDTCNFFGIPFNKFSLHLHVNKNKEKNVEEIVHKALDRKIIDFDVSLLESGGCSVTMNKENMMPNLTYDLYYKYLMNYIVNKSIRIIHKL